MYLLRFGESICWFYESAFILENRTTLTFPAMCWKFRSTEVIRAVNIFHFLSILLPKKDQTAHFFHSLMMSGLKWNFCLFEQEGTGINYKVFFSFHIQFFLCPLVQIQVLMLLMSIWHALHQLHTESTPYGPPAITRWRHFSYTITSFFDINECITIFIFALDIASTLWNVWRKCCCFCM